MHDAWRNGGEVGTVLVVTLKRESEQVAEIMTILGQLEIPVEAVSAGGPAGDDRVIVRIPPQRVLEAVLALNHRGFSDVRAYAADAGGDG